ncbi:MAG: hypothetical protein IJF00_04950 [Bacteroidaceae bacterium]|nr:hypothetical protein [Bacteroidaceae bacterium]
MKITANNTEKSEKPLAYWQQLAERYFEADTSDEEERLLKAFLATPAADNPHFDTIKAVMGFITTGKRLHTRKSNNIQRKRQYTRIIKWSAAAGITIAILLGGTTIINNAESQDICIAYINGKKYTNETIVMEQMRRTLATVGCGTHEYSIERQLSDIFNTIEKCTQ